MLSRLVRDWNRLGKRSIEGSADIVGVHKTGGSGVEKTIKITDFPQVKADNSKLNSTCHGYFRL